MWIYWIRRSWTTRTRRSTRYVRARRCGRCRARPRLVVSWALVTEAAGRPEEFSSNLTGVLAREAARGIVTVEMGPAGSAVHVLATGDEPAHSAHRKLVLPSLVAKRIKAIGGGVGSLVQRVWDQAVDDDRIEWAAAMADRLALSVVAALIGLP